MRGVGRALDAMAAAGTVTPDVASRVRTAVARALLATPARADAVVVVRHAGVEPMAWRAERDRWHHDLAADASARLVAAAREAGFAVDDEASLLALPDRDLVRAVWASSRPVPVDAEYPLFVIYTSGSTGKPKGVVHVHGGWLAGVAHTMRVAFDARAGDAMYVVADPGWITGQSYMIAAALATRVTSVLAEGAPTFPSAARFASIIERYDVQVFKAGVTFLKTVMQDPQHAHDVRRHSTRSLRVATFCAEPTSPAVQAFGMDLVTPWYINSYWATEHGGIVWTHFYGNADFPLRADAHTYPLPWVAGDVWVPAGEPAAPGGPVPWRRAEAGEKGEVVIARPYPYLCRTIWGDADGFAVEHDGAGLRVRDAWRGDGERYAATYWSRWQGAWAYTQGDFAVRHADGSFSLHGRSDDVINVSGHRLGTEEIEGAILRDRQLDPESPVGQRRGRRRAAPREGTHAARLRALRAGRRLTADDRRRLASWCGRRRARRRCRATSSRSRSSPRRAAASTCAGWCARSSRGRDPGDASTLRNPEALDELRARSPLARAPGRGRRAAGAGALALLPRRGAPARRPGSPCVAWCS
jgi:acrylyl-CoA reductase (NADPH)/3-hydroxypropionyl-CoA dehydratase/3-hydroxypropionyl-CoA synthetase